MLARAHQLIGSGKRGALAFAAVLLSACISTPATTAHKGPPFLDAWPAALRSAQSLKRPLFVDAWAPWCHTCLSMRAFVLADPILRPYYDRFVWVALDVEQETSASFLTRYPVGTLPTFLVIDPTTGAVARRWLGAMTTAELVRFLDDGLLSSAKPAEPLRQLAAAHDQQLAGKYDEAIASYLALLDTVPPAWPRRWEALVATLDAMSRRGDEIATTRCLELVERELSWVAAHPSPQAGDFVAYADDCAERRAAVEPDRVQQLRRGLAGHLVKLIDDLATPLSADDRGDAMGLLRGLHVTLGDRLQAEAIAIRRQQLLEAAAVRTPTPLVQSTYDWARAETYLWLGQPQRAIALLQAREQQLPSDYNAPHRLARVYLELGRPDEAIAACDRALRTAYGPRRVEVLGLRADALEKRGDRAAALTAATLAADELSRLAPPHQKPRLLRTTAARVKRIQAAGAAGR